MCNLLHSLCSTTPRVNNFQVHLHLATGLPVNNIPVGAVKDLARAIMETIPHSGKSALVHKILRTIRNRAERRQTL